MSNSRLEKFIYAICGMEVDDLPTPLSRIETLWNCLITGETPDFEPLSRNEKYLMSMLTGDVDALPEPTSRSEKLLYKIATGETDLTDVPGYLSRYEELLKYLIENGGIGGTDFEYVLYTLNDSFSTLYSTAEAPVKSAILKGQTLVNLQQKKTQWTINGGGRNASYSSIEGFPLSKIKPSTKYLIKFNKDISSFVGSVFFVQGIKPTWTIKGDYVIVTTLDALTTSTTGIHIYPKNDILLTEELLADVEVMILEYQEGMENWDIPYFTGMQSVKMPVLKTMGKNLFDGIMTRGQLLSNNVIQSNQTKMGYSEFLPINEDLNIYCSYYTNSSYIIEKIYFYDENKTQIGTALKPKEVTSPKMTKYFRLSITTTDWNSEVVFDDIKDDFNIQVEIGTQATSYEPFKSNILTVNEEVELRGIGDVKDELNLITGELTQRIGEVVLDGSENWTRSADFSNLTNTVHFQIQSDTVGIEWASPLISDKFINQRVWAIDLEGINCATNGSLAISINRDRLSGLEVADFKKWLSQNNVTVVGKSEESIKTVDLSTLDQEGQPTKLKTFNDITHVSIEAGDLLPTVDLEVATKIEETLSSLPTQMIDISETQHSLNEKIDEQAENIKEVSTAMIEIRSDIL